MDQANKLVRLCETRWKDLSLSKPTDLSADAAQFLSCLGWNKCLQHDTPDASLSYTVKGEMGEKLNFHFVEAGRLEPPTAIVSRGLDFCATTFSLVLEAANSSLDYILITDFYRSYLYCIATNELLLHSDTPHLFLSELYDEVTKECVDEGSLGEIRRAPMSSMARSLREWGQRWATLIEREPDGGEAVAEILLDRLITLRFFIERDIDSPATKKVQCLYSDLVGGVSDSESIRYGKGLANIFTALHSEVRCELFTPNSVLVNFLNKEHLVAPMLNEFVLISKAKFTVPAVLESFNFGDASEKARVRIVPEPDERREHYLATQTLQTLSNFHLQIDVLEEGYRAIGYWLEKLLDTCQRLRVHFNAQQPLSIVEDPDQDLLQWSEGNAHDSKSQHDPIRLGVEENLCIYYSNERQYRTARLMLCLYLIEAYAKGECAFVEFPGVESAFRERPALLDSEKQWIYQPPPDHASRGWDVV